MRRCLLLAGVLLYYCYMGADGLDEANSHKAYVNINAQVNAVLSEPVVPTRQGYRFAGWYYFDTMEQGEKIYLASVLSLRQGLSSYQAGHVYLDHVGDAHLLYQDQAGQLFYYSGQTGCRFSFYNDASVVTQTRKLCAAWESTADVTAAIYHLVAKDDAESAVTLAPKGCAAVSVTQLPALNLGGKEYLCLKTETQDQLYTGSTFQARGWEYLTDSASQKWLPTEAVIHLELSEATQTVDDFSKAAGTTCRMELPSEDGAYAYFAFVVYLPTEEVDYNLYAIDLAAAVSMGALNDFQDAFHRDQPPDQNAPYVLSMTTRSWHGGESTLVTEQAPDISGFVVYLNTTQSLQLQAQPGTNNLYFYYVKNGAKIGYALRYYLEQDGGYSETNMVEFSGVPAVRGEILRLDQLSQTFQLLVSQGELFRSYAGSADPEQAALYEQYRPMVVTLVQEGVSASFAVDHSVENSLNLEMVRELGRNYYLADWSPTGETLALEEGVKVDVYLDQAELLISQGAYGNADFDQTCPGGQWGCCLCQQREDHHLHPFHNHSRNRLGAGERTRIHRLFSDRYQHGEDPESGGVHRGGPLGRQPVDKRYGLHPLLWGFPGGNRQRPCRYPN